MATFRGSTTKRHIRENITSIIYIFALLYVIFAIVSYTYIVIKVRQSRQQFQTSDDCQYCSRVRKDYLLPGMIISSYIVLGYIPYIFMHFSYHHHDRDSWELERRSHSIGYGICDLLPTMLCLVDPLTYILFANHYRKTVLYIFFRSSPRIEVTRSIIATTRRSYFLESRM